MGVSYTIIPTSELSLEIAERRDAFLKHFKSIDSHFFPLNWQIDIQSKYPTLKELYKCFKEGQIQNELLSEEIKDNNRIQLCFDIRHKLNKHHSDLTIEHIDNELKSIHGIKGDFNMLLRLTTQLTKKTGSMIIFSAYDSYYIEKGKEYEELWLQLKNKWAGEE